MSWMEAENRCSVVSTTRDIITPQKTQKGRGDIYTLIATINNLKIFNYEYGI